MELNDKLLVYKLANHIVSANKYDILYFNENKTELWLEKVERQTSKVIRLIEHGFAWENQLNQDISDVLHKIGVMKKSYSTRKIEVYNIYVSHYSPLEIMNMESSDAKGVKMDVFFLTANNLDFELRRLEKEVGISTKLDIEPDLTDVEKEMTIQEIETKFTNIFENQRKEMERLFSFGKPFITYLLLIANIIMFYILETNGGSSNIETLIRYGAKYNPTILEGEWWRFASSMFLHIGMIHIMMNMFALYYLGTAVERIFGSWRFLFIYLLAGLGGSIASFAFTINVSAGASGAIFGLFGALLFFGFIHKKIFLQTIGKGIFFIIGINIVFGITVPQIDNSAHLGGLLTGFIASAIFHLPGNRNGRLQFSAVILYVVILLSLFAYGSQNEMNRTISKLNNLEQLIKEKKYDQVVDKTTELLNNDTNFQAELLFQRAYANIELTKYDLAIKDLEKSIQIKKDFPEAYFNLAILYTEKGEKDKAEVAITKALELRPDIDDDFQLYEKITGSSAK